MTSLRKPKTISAREIVMYCVYIRIIKVHFILTRSWRHSRMTSTINVFMEALRHIILLIVFFMFFYHLVLMITRIWTTTDSSLATFIILLRLLGLGPLPLQKILWRIKRFIAPSISIGFCILVSLGRCLCFSWNYMLILIVLIWLCLH